MNKLYFQEQVLDTVVLLIWSMFEFIGLSRWYNFILKKSLKTYFLFQQSQFCVNTDEVKKKSDKCLLPAFSIWLNEIRNMKSYQI